MFTKIENNKYFQNTGFNIEIGLMTLSIKISVVEFSLEEISPTMSGDLNK